MGNSVNPQFRGVAGEIEVARILSGFNRQQYIVLNNILLRKQYVKSGEVPTVQIDHLVVSLYGIFSIETKNYAGKIYGYEDAKTWKVYLAGQQYEMQNPLRQNHAHTKTLQKLLINNATQLGIQNADFLIYPIIAFSERADISKIQVQGVDIVYYNQLPNAILRKSVSMQLTPQQMENIAAFINSQNIYSPETMRQHIDDIRRLKGDYTTQQNTWTVPFGNTQNANIYVRSTERNPLTEAEQYREQPTTSFQQFTSEKQDIKYSARRRSGKGWLIALILGLGIPFTILMFIILFIVLIAVLSSGLTMNQNNNQPQITNNSSVTTVSTPATNYQIREQTLWEEPGGNETTCEKQKNLPDEMDITAVDGILTEPRKNVTDGIIYFAHGGYHDEEYARYTDSDGEVYDEYINMYYHNAWPDVFIDLNAESYNTLKFKYVGPPAMFFDYTILKIKVYDRDTEELIYECDKAKKGHTQNAEIDITGHDHIRLVFVDEYNGACYCYLKDVILCDPVE